VIREISGRVSLSILQYVKDKAPDRLSAFFEDHDEEFLSNENEWISYQAANRLFRQAEITFARDDIMVEIGRESAWLGALGLTQRLIRLGTRVDVLINLAVQYMHLLDRVSQVRVQDRDPRRVVVEYRCLPGYVRTRGACNYHTGLFYSLLKGRSVHAGYVGETQCAVPIWEKGVLGHEHFFLRGGQLWRKDLLTGVEQEAGPLGPEGTYTHGGTVYGAPACVYHITWDEHRALWEWILDYLFFRPQLLARVRRELLGKYEIIERQNSHLRRTNQVLANLLKERTELNLNLELKVSERTRELAYTVEQLKELDQMKSNFLSVTSHELRTPLTVIKAALSLLLSEGHAMDPARYHKYLNMAYENSESLIKLIDNLLDFSRLESGRMVLELKGVNLPLLVQDTLKDFRSVAGIRHVELSGETPVEIPLVVCSPVRIKQILANLLSNALKFTPAGGWVKVLLRWDEEFVDLEVADNGIGMSEAQRKRIFSKFFQVDDSLTREVGGVGLGLALVKKLVEMHEGLVLVESKEGEGSRFIIRLPVRGPQQGPAGARPGQGET
jgi:signal transduction histidine kinase